MKFDRREGREIVGLLNAVQREWMRVRMVGRDIFVHFFFFFVFLWE